MLINKRLLKIADFISSNSFILDVGCDHALLDVYLALEKKCTCLASDIHDGPILKAKLNLLKHKVTKQVKLLTCDGIPNIKTDVDYLVLSGMGAITICNILERGDLSLIKKIIVSPNGEEELVRKKLNELNYKTLKEELVRDKNIIYPVLMYEKGTEKLTKMEIKYGKLLMNNKDSLYQEYYTKKIDTYKNIKKGLPKKYIIKKIKLHKKIREISSIL